METLREALSSLSAGPFADLFESEEAYVIVMDLPGATSDTIDIECKSGRIQVEASRSKDVGEEFRYVREDRPIFLDATLPVPADANGEEASASIEHGVLELRLPKRPVSDRDIAIE